MIEKLKTVQFKKSEKAKNENIEYLQNLKHIVGRGLSELYKIQPKNPITFLSEWLLAQSSTEPIKDQLEKKTTLITNLKEKYTEIENKKINLENEKKKYEESKKQEKLALEESIKDCLDFEDHLNDICEDFKNIIGATGVYVFKYDYKRVFPIEIYADENGHIDPSNQKVLRYVNWCADHTFLHRKFLEVGSGVTYKLIGISGEGDEEENKEENKEDEGEEGEKDDEKKEEVLKNIFIEEVVNENKIKFFREPRLGCYFAIDIRYNSSLNYNALKTAIENLEDYKIKKADYDKRMAEKEEEEKQRELEKKENEENEDEEEKEKKENEGGEEGEEEDLDKPPELKEFEKEEKIYILCIDTLGQEKVYNEEERNYILKIAKLIRDSMQNLEIKLLEKDRDLRIEYLNSEKTIKEEYDEDRIVNEQDNAVKDYAASDEFANKNITDEDERQIDMDVVKAKAIINLIYNTEMINLINIFSNFEFVQYEKIFQNLFYLNLWCLTKMILIN